LRLVADSFCSFRHPAPIAAATLGSGNRRVPAAPRASAIRVLVAQPPEARQPCRAEADRERAVTREPERVPHRAALPQWAAVAGVDKWDPEGAQVHRAAERPASRALEVPQRTPRRMRPARPVVRERAAARAARRGIAVPRCAAPSRAAACASAARRNALQAAATRSRSNVGAAPPKPSRSPRAARKRAIASSPITGWAAATCTRSGSTSPKSRASRPSRRAAAARLPAYAAAIA